MVIDKYDVYKGAKLESEGMRDRVYGRIYGRTDGEII